MKNTLLIIFVLFIAGTIAWIVDGYYYDKDLQAQADRERIQPSLERKERMKNL